MPNFLINRYQIIDKTDQIDLTNLAIPQYSPVFSIGGSWKSMANETTQTSVFDSTPDSQMYEYKQSIEKVQTELLKYGLTLNQSKVFIYLGKYGAKTAPEVCKALKLPEPKHIICYLLYKTRELFQLHFSILFNLMQYP